MNDAQRTLNITELFYSIQGETSFSGLPFIFIRLTGCNLRCSYCDTKYAYDGGQELLIDTISGRLKEFPCRRVTITGGEPLLQKNSFWLMDTLVQNGYTVLLETNGTVDISSVNKSVVRVVDIKCPGSNHADSFDFSNIAHLRERDEVKFVLTDERDYEFAREIIMGYQLTKKCKVIISAAYERAPLETFAKRILEDGLDVRLQMQLHKYIFGDKEGV